MPQRQGRLERRNHCGLTRGGHTTVAASSPLPISTASCRTPAPSSCVDPLCVDSRPPPTAHIAPVQRGGVPPTRPRARGAANNQPRRSAGLDRHPTRKATQPGPSRFTPGPDGGRCAAPPPLSRWRPVPVRCTQFIAGVVVPARYRPAPFLPAVAAWRRRPECQVATATPGGGRWPGRQGPGRHAGGGCRAAAARPGRRPAIRCLC